MLVYHCPCKKLGEFMHSMKHNNDGFTGLEAAIVLIAFIVVAAVFSYVVLGAGFFTTQKAQETIYRSVEQSSTNIQIVGNVYGLSNDTSQGISEIRFSIGLFPGSSSVDLSKYTIVFSTPTAKPKFLTWTNANASQTMFTTKVNGVGSSVSSLDVNQQVEIDFLTEYVLANSKMTIEIHPSVGAALPFSKTAPATIANTNLLY
jgi:flagellin FlaB